MLFRPMCSNYKSALCKTSLSLNLFFIVSTQDVFILRFSDYKSQTYTDTMTLIQKNET